MWCWVALLYGVFWISSSTALICSSMAMRCETERVGPLKTFQRAALLPHCADAFRLQTLDGVQDQPPGTSRVRRQVEAAQHAVDEQAGFVEHLLEFREGVRADGRGEFPRLFPVDDHLAGLEPPPEQIKRRILEDDGPVVPRLPALRRQPCHEAVAVEQLHEELSPRPKRASDSSQDLAVLFRPIEVSERR